MELKETVEMMTSEDYKERFKAEYYQNVIRRDGLTNMLDKWAEGKLDFTPTCPRNAYRMQLNAMENYIAVLELRAIVEGIEL